MKSRRKARRPSRLPASLASHGCLVSRLAALPPLTLARPLRCRGFATVGSFAVLTTFDTTLPKKPRGVYTLSAGSGHACLVSSRFPPYLPSTPARPLRCWGSGVVGSFALKPNPTRPEPRSRKARPRPDLRSCKVGSARVGSHDVSAACTQTLVRSLVNAPAPTPARGPPRPSSQHGSLALWCPRLPTRAPFLRYCTMIRMANRMPLARGPPGRQVIFCCAALALVTWTSPFH